MNRLPLRLREAVRPLRDPGVRATVALLVVAAGGFALFGLGWRGAARTVYVPFQLPWAMSAGIAGAAVIGTALIALGIHLGRRSAAAERVAIDEMSRTAYALINQLATRQGGPSGRRH